MWVENPGSRDFTGGNTGFELQNARSGIVGSQNNVLPVSFAKEIDIIVPATLKCVVSRTPVEYIVAIFAAQRVIACTAIERVITVEPLQIVVALLAVDGVVIICTSNDVIRRGASEQHVKQCVHVPGCTVSKFHLLNRVRWAQGIPDKVKVQHNLVSSTRNRKYQIVSRLADHDLARCYAIFKLQQI